MANLTSGIGGAGTGAGIGSMFGPIGTAIGGGLGFLTGLFGGNTATPYNTALNPQDQARRQAWLKYLQGMAMPSGSQDMRNIYTGHNSPGFGGVNGYQTNQVNPYTALFANRGTQRA